MIVLYCLLLQCTLYSPTNILQPKNEMHIIFIMISPMNKNMSAIQYMSLIMKFQTLKIDYALSMVEIVNNSYLNARNIVTVLQDIFKKQKSNRILLAVQVLQYLIKNGNRNFHEAANRQSFQKSVLGLLKRQRGKFSIIKQLSSNTDNWIKIQSRILYLIQLWYDAFILEQGKYPNIINTYKVLRKQNIIFPPRNINEKSLIAVKTQSPIFDNIQTIVESDNLKFKKKLKAMGMNNLSERFELKEKELKEQPIKKQLNIDQISQKIAIINSQNSDLPSILAVINQVKYSMDHMKLKPNQEKYWKEVKEAADKLIQDWEHKNAKFIEEQEQKYLEEKINGKKGQNNSEHESPNIKGYGKWNNGLNDKLMDNKQPAGKVQTVDLLSGDDYQVEESSNKNKNKAENVNNNNFDEWTEFNSFENQNDNENNKKKIVQQVNLLEI